MADQLVRRSKTKYYLLVIPWSTDTWEEREPYRFGTKDIDKSRCPWVIAWAIAIYQSTGELHYCFRIQYLKNRALESFKESGLLEEINYVE